MTETIQGLHSRTISASPLFGENSIFPTGSATLWRINYANSKQLYVKVVKATSTTQGMINNKVFEYVTAGKSVYDEVVELPDKQDLQDHWGFYMLPELPAGAYWLLISDRPSSKWDKNTPRECYLFQISDIEILPRVTEFGLEILALHRKTGEPLSNAKVSMYRNVVISSLLFQEQFCLTIDVLFRCPGLSHFF